VVRDRDRRHLQLNGFLDKVVDADGAVEQAVFGVKVKVDEIGVMHIF